jgi:hypothetical protein
MKAVNNFAGLNGFVWWVGSVENVADPLGIGRCQVRIFGWHTDNTSMIPTTELPWAHPMYSINSSNIHQPLQHSDWVVGFFMDGESGQFPIMMGVLPGMSNITTPKQAGANS